MQSCRQSAAGERARKRFLDRYPQRYCISTTRVSDRDLLVAGNGEAAAYRHRAAFAWREGPGIRLARATTRYTIYLGIKGV